MMIPSVGVGSEHGRGPRDASRPWSPGRFHGPPPVTCRAIGSALTERRWCRATTAWWPRGRFRPGGSLGRCANAAGSSTGAMRRP